MIHTYGPFHLSVQGIIGIAFVAVLILIAAMVTFRLQHMLAGFFFSLASGASLLIVMVTVWTILEQTRVSVMTLFGAMLGSIVVPVTWAVLLILSVFPKRKAVSKSHN